MLSCVLSKILNIVMMLVAVSSIQTSSKETTKSSSETSRYNYSRLGGDLNYLGLANKPLKKKKTPETNL